MLTFLLFLFIIFFVLPRIVLKWLLPWYVRRRMRKMQDNMRQAYEQTYGSASGADANGRTAANAHSNSGRRGKRIDPSVGEYVQFEEIIEDTATTVETDAAGDTTVTTESQIEDAVWEDVK